ncbi:MAG: CAP domain-containing protein [Acidobacteriota bacterium]|nr:CAP domain-containing protein [Acidobacteriota bacterium]
MARRTGRIATGAWLAAAVAAYASGSGAALIDARPIAAQVLELIQEERYARGVPPLERRRALDEIAEKRARAIAARPLSDRLKSVSSIDRSLLESGTVRFRRARGQLHLQKNHPEPARGAYAAWRRKPQSWDDAMSPEMDGVGIAAVRAADLWLVMVAIVVDDPPTAAELAGLEVDLLDRINDIRTQHGLSGLAESAALAEIARAHSRDMASRGYFAHVSPEGLAPADRLRVRGEKFSRLSENIFMTDDPDETLALAVESWMDSPGHRENILDADAEESAVGIALADDGALYFTQLFRGPRPAP